MNSTVPVITSQEAGDNLWFGGGLVSFKVTSEQSGRHPHSVRARRRPWQDDSAASPR